MNINSFLNIKHKIILFLILIIQTNSQSFISIINGDSNDGKNNYYTTLYLGESKKPQNFLLDTLGSIISSPCHLYSSSTSYLNMMNEVTKEKDIINCQNDTCSNFSYSSCINEQCNFEYNYNNSTIKGIYANKYISFLQEEESHIFPFGCSVSQTNEFLTKNTYGILGLNSNENSIINILYKKKIIKKNLFSICINQNEGGYLYFGQINEEYHSNKQKDKNKNMLINYMPFTLSENGFYTLSMSSLNIEDSKNILNSNTNCIIDSLSVKSYLTDSIYNIFINEFLLKCLKKKGNCNNIQKVEGLGYCSTFKSKQNILKSINKYWPKITLGFNGYNHILSPINYFIIYSLLGKINACVGFEKTDKNYNILGTTFLKGYDVIFDNEDKKIGLIESNCDIKIKNIKKTELNEEYMNRVFDDPVNIIIVCISIGGIIILALVLYVLYREFYNKRIKRKGYIRQVDVVNPNNTFEENKNNT